MDTISRHILPMLRDAGVSGELIDQMLVRNPRRILGVARMKAALLIGPGKIVIDDVPEPEVGPEEVRIAVGGVGLCGSDLSVFSGAWTAPSYPWVMGHEAFGRSRRSV